MGLCGSQWHMKLSKDRGKNGFYYNSKSWMLISHIQGGNGFGPGTIRKKINESHLCKYGVNVIHVK